MGEAGQLSPNERLLVTLPIYHGNGHFIGIGNSIINGVTVILRKKFSASKFWKDAIDSGVTRFVYVGEICRFLVNQPKSVLDRKHKIKIAIGNGLRKNIWNEFTNRFGIKIIEFYAATEGNCQMGMKNNFNLL